MARKRSPAFIEMATTMREENTKSGVKAGVLSVSRENEVERAASRGQRSFNEIKGLAGGRATFIREGSWHRSCQHVKIWADRHPGARLGS